MNAFDGSTYDAKRDGKRLTAQLDCVKSLMMDGEWRTLDEIAAEIDAPASTASVSARLRDLRKARFGSYIVERKYLSGGAWVYRVLAGPSTTPV